MPFSSFLSLLAAAARRAVRVRMADWMVASLLLLALVLAMAPQQLPVTLYKLCLVGLAALAGWWVDRSLFPYARPERWLEPLPEMGDKPTGETDFAGHLAGALQFAEGQAPGLDAHAAALLGRAAMLRRALIVAAAMLAVGLGA